MTRAERNIRWCEEHIRIPEGRFVGQPLKMADYMKEDFRAIYDNPNGTRRAIVSRGRKNAKSTECAMILLLHLVGPEATPNAQLFSAAQSRDQASLIFSLAAKIVRMSPDLSRYITIRDTAKQLACSEWGSLYRALSADASTAFGLSPSLVIHDELGQVNGPRSQLYEALETATAAQAEPLSIVISTQAPTESDLLSVLIDDAKAGHDPRTVLRLNTAPPELDPFTEEAIRAANPAFDIFMNKAEVLAMAQDARRMPSRQAEYENLVLNRRVESRSPFVSASVWKANGGDVAPSFAGHRVWAGLDLSQVSELTARGMSSRRSGCLEMGWPRRPGPTGCHMMCGTAKDICRRRLAVQSSTGLLLNTSRMSLMSATSRRLPLTVGGGSSSNRGLSRRGYRSIGSLNLARVSHQWAERSATLRRFCLTKSSGTACIRY